MTDVSIDDFTSWIATSGVQRRALSKTEELWNKNVFIGFENFHLESESVKIEYVITIAESKHSYDELTDQLLTGLHSGMLHYYYISILKFLN